MPKHEVIPIERAQFAYELIAKVMKKTHNYTNLQKASGSRSYKWYMPRTISRHQLTNLLTDLDDQQIPYLLYEPDPGWGQPHLTIYVPVEFQLQPWKKLAVQQSVCSDNKRSKEAGMPKTSSPAQSNWGYQAAKDIDVILNRVCQNYPLQYTQHYLEYLRMIRTVQTSLELIEAQLNNPYTRPHILVEEVSQ